MKIVEQEGLQYLNKQLNYWAYNALDCTQTRRIADALLPRLRPEQDMIYGFERACQAPAMAMMRRGVLVDQVRRNEAVTLVKRELKKTERALNKLPYVREVWDGTELETGICPENDGKRHKWPRGVPDIERSCLVCGIRRVKPKPLNLGSWQQVWRLLYDLKGIPQQRNKKRDYSVDETVLERIRLKFPETAESIDLILEGRGQKKQIGFLGSKLSSDGRMRSSFNVGAPETGRWSSSQNAYREGTNLQNIAEKHRVIFIADPGKELVYCDLEQAESRCVAYDAGDTDYIEAHLSGDVHTFVARMLWPDLDWTGDMAEDRKVADQDCHFDPDHSYRYNAKRCQHGLNYGLSPQGLAMLEHIPVKAARAVYHSYFEHFPYVLQWQRDTGAEIKEKNVITTPLGRRRQFFGRPWDPHVVRQGIAYVPQSMVADILNVSLWRVWKDMDPFQVQLLAQVHDAILFQVDKGNEGAIQGVKKRMEIPVLMSGERTMTIPTDVARGHNWGKYDAELNPGGMK